MLELNKKEEKINFELYSSNVKSNDSFDKFSNLSLTICAGMIPLFLLNLDEISNFYIDINPKQLITFNSRNIKFNCIAYEPVLL